MNVVCIVDFVVQYANIFVKIAYHFNKYKYKKKMTIFDPIIQEIIKRQCVFKLKVRKEPTPKVKAFLEEYGEKEITSITICKTPVEKYIKTTLNILSLGKFNKNLERLHYDNIFHLYIYVTIGNEQFIMEKNEIVEVTKTKQRRPKENCIKVPMSYTITKKETIKQHPRQRFTGQLVFGGRTSRTRLIRETINKKIKVKDFFNNAIKHQNNEFFYYHPRDNNCQVFIETLLLANGLINYGDVRHIFIKQKAYEMFRDTQYVARFGKKLTDLANILNAVQYGC